jgi:hypothetical protein
LRGNGRTWPRRRSKRFQSKHSRTSLRLPESALRPLGGSASARPRSAGRPPMTIRSGSTPPGPRGSGRPACRPEAVGRHERLRAAFGAHGEQLERAAATWGGLALDRALVGRSYGRGAWWPGWPAGASPRAWSTAAGRLPQSGREAAGADSGAS